MATGIFILDHEKPEPFKCHEPILLIIPESFMFEAEPVEGSDNISILKSCSTFLGRPMMWVAFMLVDNVLIDSGNAGCDRMSLKQFLIRSVPAKELVILNTHVHEDHCGNNGFIQKELEAEIFVPMVRDDYANLPLFYRIFWGNPDPFTCRKLPSDAIVTASGRTIRRIPSPGHTACHVCYHIVEDDILFTGDACPLASKKIYSMPEENYIQAAVTLKELYSLIAKDTRVVDGHLGLLAAPEPHVRERIENMEEVIRHVRDRATSGVNDISIITRELRGKKRLYEYLAGPRISVESTIRSILGN